MTAEQQYAEFLKSKRLSFPPCGFEPKRLNKSLFSWQRPVVEWACRKGKAAMWEGCGLGKTIQQLEWARQVVKFSSAPVLILAPLAVAEQTREEAEKFGIAVDLCRSQSDCGPGINITNYEMLQHFDCDRFAGVVLDESSILKDYSSRTRNELIDAFKRTPYKLACSATPAPNDHMELANHAEFLGVMTRTEMLSMFFVHDGGDTSKWRLKGHAVDEFWKWVASWAVMIQKPSDIGFEDEGYILPELRWHQVTVQSRGEADTLFGYEASDLMERRAARKESISDRVDAVAQLVNEDPQSQWLIWCDLNDESAALKNRIIGAVEVKGADSREHKTESMKAFAHGSLRKLISKPSIFGWGANWQNCHKVVFCGLSDSFEQIYQAVRRCWRFGQINQVDAYIVTSEAEGAVVRNINRKQSDFDRMSARMVEHMKAEMWRELRSTERVETAYDPQVEMVIPAWMKGEAA